MFHFTRRRIEAHICICFVALKVYKELERMLKVSEIKMSVDKVLALAKTITTIQIKLPLNKEIYTQTMLMARHQKIAKLFDEETVPVLGVLHCEYMPNALSAIQNYNLVSLGTINPMTNGIATESQRVICFVVNLEKMNSHILTSHSLLSLLLYNLRSSLSRISI